jgi:hypothetical protein
MFPSFDQRTVSPTEIEMFSGLKNPTHGLGLPSHRSTSPIDTKWVFAATVVLVVVVDVVVVVLELVAEVVVDGGEVVVVGLVDGVVVDSTVVEPVVEVVLVVPGTGSGRLVVAPRVLEV